MTANHRLFTAALTAALALLASSCKKDGASGGGSGGDHDKPRPPGATNDGPIIAEFDYKDLDYDNGLIIHDGALFTGRAIMRYPDGSRKGRFNYVDGRYDGIVEEWYENGQRSALKHFKAGKQHGITNYWDESGTPTKMALYENDVEIEAKTGDDIPKNLGL